jgi:hypothetical protein
MAARQPPAPGRDEIVAALRRLAKRLGRTPRSTEVRRNAPEVYRALFQHFHSIAAAVEGAGLAAVGLPRKWSRELVVAELRRLHRRGEGVSRRKLIEAGRYDLVNAIVTYCGGMTAARRVARLPPAASGPRGRSKWSEDEVIAQIRERRRRGLPLASSKVPRKLHDAAGYYLGGWRQAVEAAGLEYDQVRLTRPAYDRDEIIATLRVLAKSQPHMTLSDLRRHRIKNGVETVFPSLEKALQAAGLGQWPRRDLRRQMPTAEATIAAIRARHARGLPMFRAAVHRDDLRLERAGVRNFGSWIPALRAAGLAAVTFRDQPQVDAWSPRARRH